jgi:hypothetical protein
VPVKGTLTINGQPADGLTITFSPTDPAKPAASGPVKNGAFELFSGVQGKPGAVPGKYKVVLSKAGGADSDAVKASYMPGSKSGAKTSAPPKQELGFPQKYAVADTSDKEVEVKSGSNDIKIEISGQ